MSTMSRGIQGIISKLPYHYFLIMKKTKCIEILIKK